MPSLRPVYTFNEYKEEFIRFTKEAVGDKKVLENAVADMQKIAGQKPVVTKSRKSIAGFKIRDGWPIGCKVTLRDERMYEFVERLVSIAIPRIRDFRGISAKQFDGRGNFAMGITEQIIFPEINYDEVDTLRGMDITITTTALGEHIALHVLNDKQRHLSAAQDRVTANKAILCDWIDRQALVDWVEPTAGVVGLGRLSAEIDDPDWLYDRLIEQYGTMTIPGKYFGVDNRFFRLGFGGEPSDISEGLRRFDQALADCSNRAV